MNRNALNLLAPARFQSWTDRVRPTDRTRSEPLSGKTARCLNALLWSISTRIQTEVSCPADEQPAHMRPHRRGPAPEELCK